jgi:protein-tyrosine phosphatase
VHEPASATDAAAIRALAWEGCVNARDLGGHPTEDGGETRFGRIVRADSVRQLSDAGWKALVGYGTGRIVDLRWHEELEADPPRDLPVEVVHVPLFGSRGEMDEINELIADLERPVESRRATYLEALERFSGNFADAMDAVAGAPEGAVVVHCAGGVDRTGLVSALILRLAGVSREEIAADYALSGQNWAPFMEEWIEAAETEQDRGLRRLLSVVPAEAMAETLETLETQQGSVRSYLREAGVSETSLDRVVARLRD